MHRFIREGTRPARGCTPCWTGGWRYRVPPTCGIGDASLAVETGRLTSREGHVPQSWVHAHDLSTDGALRLRAACHQSRWQSSYAFMKVCFTCVVHGKTKAFLFPVSALLRKTRCCPHYLFSLELSGLWIHCQSSGQTLSTLCAPSCQFMVDSCFLPASSNCWSLSVVLPFLENFIWIGLFIQWSFVPVFFHWTKILSVHSCHGIC